MRVQISDHRDKANALRRAILDAGHEVVAHHADLLLIDWDGPIAHYPRVIERAYAEGAEVYLYTHGCPPLTCWDGIWKPGAHTRGLLAQTEGEKGVLERYGYPYPVDVIGWHFCEQREFQPAREVKNILFAPWHPQGTGYLHPEGKRQNAGMFQALTSRNSYNLNIRYAYELEWNNIPHAAGVNYIPSNMTLRGMIDAIDAADLVIGIGTAAYMAVARGKPCVMYGQDVRPHDGYSDATFREVKHWEKYRDYMRYPINAYPDSPEQVWRSIEYAAEHEAELWRETFIGKPFDPVGFVALLERLKGQAHDD